MLLDVREDGEIGVFFGESLPVLEITGSPERIRVLEKIESFVVRQEKGFIEAMTDIFEKQDVQGANLGKATSNVLYVLGDQTR